MDNYVCSKEKTPSIAHVYWMSDSFIAIPMCIYRFFVYIHVHVASSVGLLRQYPGAGVQCVCLRAEGGGGILVGEGDGTDVYDYYSYYSIKNNHTHYN